jgi:flagellar export protein FliJ
MKKFQFKFASILRVRKLREEESLRLLGVAQRAFQAEIQRKSRLESELKAALIRREEMGAPSSSASDEVFIELLDIKLEQSFIEGIKQKIIQSTQAVSRANRGVEKALRGFLFARRQTRMMEMLYEKHYLEFKKELNKKQLAEMDELANTRAYFNSVGSSLVSSKESA